MAGTIVGLVTPHLLRIIDLANEAEKGANVDWHLRGTVSTSMDELCSQWNAPALIAAYVDGLETVAGQAPPTRTAYIRVMHAAAAAARGLRRE